MLQAKPSNLCKYLTFCNVPRADSTAFSNICQEQMLQALKS